MYNVHMRLFLASALDQTLGLLGDKLNYALSGKKIIFIANASDNEVGDKWWIDIDREAFSKQGCVIQEVDIRTISPAEFKKFLSDSDIVHFCGGSVLHLITLLRKNNLIEPLITAVREEDVLYTGTSAGSMVVAEDLSLCKWDPDEQTYITSVNDFSGVGFVNFLILPHANNKDFVTSNLRMIEKMSECKQVAIALYDNRAIWVDNDKIQILNS